ncbi:hypothetical protein QBC43DRAFT_290960 [Cladorrhinum sp. PSN259]|nr:hypothetical protein QBC43DRAFT_290960 [Cladorrhinum sp. PSN259]
MYHQIIISTFVTSSFFSLFCSLFLLLTPLAESAATIPISQSFITSTGPNTGTAAAGAVPAIPYTVPLFPTSLSPLTVPIGPIPTFLSSTCKYPNVTSSTNITTRTVIFTPAPSVNQTTVSWTTLPIASLTGDPFCVNQASPQQGIGNHCVCSNGATLSIIPWTKGGNVSDYQPCAYTTVDGGRSQMNATTVVVVGGL